MLTTRPLLAQLALLPGSQAGLSGPTHIGGPPPAPPLAAAGPVAERSTSAAFIQGKEALITTHWCLKSSVRGQQRSPVE